MARNILAILFLIKTIMIKLSDLVQIIINEYIEYPQLILIEEIEQIPTDLDDASIVIRIHTPSKTDTGKLIGKLGRNIDLLRRLINIVASKRGIKVNLHIIS